MMNCLTKYKLFLASFIIFFFSMPLNFVMADILILSPNTIKAHAVAEKIKRELGQYKVVISENPDAVKKPQLTITLGSSQLRSHLSNTPTLAAFVSPSEYDDWNTSSHFLSKPVYSVISPQSLIKYINDTFGSVRVGYVYKNDLDGYISELQALSNVIGPIVVPIKLQNNDIFKTLRRMISQDKVDIMIISNDRKIYNRKNIRFVLEALYRQKIPTIGLSKNLVDAGAVAAVFSNDDLLIKQTVIAANRYLITGNFSNAMYAEISNVIYKKSFVDEFNITLKGKYILQ